jgi:hypothetical protein
MKLINLLFPTILTLTTLFISHHDLFAQNADYNHFKYWIYRDRLLKEFVVPGFAQPNGAGCYSEMSGYSIPSSTITIASGYPDTLWHKRLEFGDGTENLGWYISVLATEYELLRRSNFSQEEEKKSCTMRSKLLIG